MYMWQIFFLTVHLQPMMQSSTFIKQQMLNRLFSGCWPVYQVTLKEGYSSPIHTNAYHVSFFISAKRKQNIFVHTNVFLSFSPAHTKTLGNNWHLVLGLHDHPPSSIDAPIWTRNDGVWRFFYVTVFKRLCFHLSTLEKKRFQNDSFSSFRFHQRFRAF